MSPASTANGIRTPEPRNPVRVNWLKKNVCNDALVTAAVPDTSLIPSLIGSADQRSEQVVMRPLWRSFTFKRALIAGIAG